MAGRRARTIVAEVAAGLAELVPDPDRPRAWTLLVDGTPQSHVDLDDPRWLEFEYVRWLAHLVDAVAPPGDPIDALHLGGGAWTLARYVAATRPRSRQRVVDIDAALVQFVRERLPVAARSGIRVRVADARAALAAVRPGSMQLVLVDVFAGARIPRHLSTREFVHQVAAVLRPGGLHAINLADGAPLRFARALAATVAEAYPHPGLICSPAVLRGRRYGNLVLLGSTAPLPAAALVRALAGESFPGRLLDGPQFRDFHSGAAVLTDESAVESPLPPPGWLDGAGRR